MQDYDREVEDEDDSERYDLEDDREEEVPDDVEPVEDHNEAQFSEVQNEDQ